MFPAPGRDNDIVRNKDEIRLRTSQDRQTFWAWRGTPGGMWFGIAAAAPGHKQWLYAETQPPTGGPEADEGWRKSTDPPRDWT